MTTALVTGAAGFVGTHLLNALRAQGKNTIGIDIRPPSTLTADSWLTRDLTTLTKNDETAKADEIYHLAALVGVKATQADPQRTRSTIIAGTKAALDVARRADARLFVFVSSSEVYGQSSGVITEATEIRPLTEYGQAKAEAENIAQQRAQELGLACLIIRPFNVYGPGQRRDFVISKFVDLAIRNEPLPIVGDGTQRRTYTFVDDFVRGMMAAASQTFSEFPTYNIVGSETVDVKTLARTIIDNVGSQSPLHLHTSHHALGRSAQVEITDRVASHEHASRHLNYAPRVNLDTGIRAVAASLYGQHA